jgi:hypothetical protein
MPATPIDRVTAGQVLEQPVTNASGVTLVRAGTELTGPLLSRLRDLGYLQLDVAPTGEALIEARAAARAAIEDRFRGHEQNPLMMQIRDLLIDGHREHGRAR